MANITLKGNEIHTMGDLPNIGSYAPDFTLTTLDLSEKSLSDFQGKTVVLNIFPSVDTATCALSVHRFNKMVSELEETYVLCISKDLPFAQKRFCGAEGIEEAVMLSEYKDFNFSETYQLGIVDGPLQGLMSRVVIVINNEGDIIYTEQVAEITDEPNYDEVLKVLKK